MPSHPILSHIPFESLMHRVTSHPSTPAVPYPFGQAHSERNVCFRLHAQSAQLDSLFDEGALPLIKALQLEARHSLTNMHAFGADGDLVKLGSPQEVIEHHAPVRLRLYETRKAHLLSHRQRELSLVEARARFIDLVLRDELNLSRTSTQQLVTELHRHGFDPNLATIPPTANGGAANGHAAPSAEEIDGAGSSPGLESSGGAYDYLLRMPMVSLTEERVVKLTREKEAKRREVDVLQASSAKSMWQQELDELRSSMESTFGRRT
jgi:DNA topoisomerase II